MKKEVEITGKELSIFILTFNYVITGCKHTEFGSLVKSEMLTLFIKVIQRLLIV
jgi:hypothetical protein